MTVFTEQRKEEERLMMLWLKDQQQWVMYRLEVGKKKWIYEDAKTVDEGDMDQAVDLGEGRGTRGSAYNIF